MNTQDKKILNKISQAIFDKKGFNILVLDVRGQSTMTDYFIIAEGSVDRHVKALSTAVKGILEEVGLKVFHIEGERDADWIVMDCGEVVIHLFTPDLREKYALEEVWKKGKIVDVDIMVQKTA
jgi:ribosome-associated protein